MDVTFHRLIPRDLRRALAYYESEGGPILGDRFFRAVEECVVRIHDHPEANHFSDSGCRRAALETFPYHFLYEIDSSGIGIAVLRHDRRHPSYGLRRQRRD
jgi:plasmid stabilization system protein ParE